MGNTLNCSEVICNESIYELEWINNKNWLIECENENNLIECKNENNYNIINGNFKIFNNGLTFYKLIKKIENIEMIEKIYIQFLFQYSLLNNNFFKINLYLTNDVHNLNNSINHFTIQLNELNIKKNIYKINNEFKYELSINFSYLNFIIFQEYIKSNENIIYNQLINKNYKKYNNMYFIIVIQSNLKNNENQNNYLNLKIV